MDQQHTLELALQVCVELGATASQQDLELPISCFEEVLTKSRAVRDAVFSQGMHGLTGQPSATSAWTATRQRAAFDLLLECQNTLRGIVNSDGDVRHLQGDAEEVYDKLSDFFLEIAAEASGSPLKAAVIFDDSESKLTR